MGTGDQPRSRNWRTSGMVARAVGIVAIALGFILGMHGLDEQGAQWLQTALALLVTGMLAAGLGVLGYVSAGWLHRHARAEAV